MLAAISQTFGFLVPVEIGVARVLNQQNLSGNPFDRRFLNARLQFLKRKFGAPQQTVERSSTAALPCRAQNTAFRMFPESVRRLRKTRVPPLVTKTNLAKLRHYGIFVVHSTPLAQVVAQV
jgi:hypothetical protein